MFAKLDPFRGHWRRRQPVEAKLLSTFYNSVLLFPENEVGLKSFAKNFDVDDVEVNVQLLLQVVHLLAGKGI